MKRRWLRSQWWLRFTISSNKVAAVKWWWVGKAALCRPARSGGG